MIAGINDLLSDLSSEGMSMIIVTHDLHFAQKISQKIYFLAEGLICETGETQSTLKNPQSPRLKEFLDQCRFE
jgi:polar amino acid transport system ATP-binding protein